MSKALVASIVAAMLSGYNDASDKHPDTRKGGGGEGGALRCINAESASPGSVPCIFLYVKQIG